MQTPSKLDVPLEARVRPYSQEQERKQFRRRKQPVRHQSIRNGLIEGKKHVQGTTAFHVLEPHL